jgi:hypothetical protein
LTFWLAAMACLAVGSGDVAAQPVIVSNYKLKAVFLYNFAQFVEWPPTAFPTAQTHLIIGVLGEDPFGGDLDQAVRGEKVGTRQLEIRRYKRVEDIGSCHILFISPSEESRLDEILASLAGRSILTVGDGDDFSRRGGMIRLVTEKNRVRMRVNVEAARRAGLTISSKLLRSAEIVTND